MANTIICQCQAPSAARAVAYPDIAIHFLQGKRNISRGTGPTHVSASSRRSARIHIARLPVFRYELQTWDNKLGGQKRPQGRSSRFKETSVFNKGPLSTQLNSQLFFNKTKKHHRKAVVVPVAVTNLDDGPGSAAQAVEQLNQSLEKAVSSAKSIQGVEALQESLHSVNQSLAAVIEKVTEISSTRAPNLSASAGSKFSSLDTLQEGFSRLAQKSSEVSTAALSLIPTDVGVLQSQIDQLTSNLGSSERFKPLQESLINLSQSLATTLEKVSSVSSSAVLDATNASNPVKSSSLERLGHSASSVASNVGLLISEVGSRISHLPTGGINLDTSSLATSVDHVLSQVGTTVAGYSGGFGIDAPPMATSALLATIATSTMVVSSFNYADSRKGFVEGQDLPLRYNADTINAYFKRRPVDIFLRSTKILLSCSALTVNILFDKYVGRDQELEKLRATQLVELIARLGPTAIKIGQALSIRPDILSVVYLEELQKLQDRVPPFSNEEAKRLILEGLGKPAEEIFSEFSKEPVAAASLGQVYKARLRATGDVVAVKVQRPGVLEGISRDLFLLRQGARAFQSLPSVQSDLVALIDNWAIRFFDELDYVQEAKNAIRFSEDMRLLPNVTVPGVFLNHTSRKVLTSAWVDGEKLSDTKAADLLPLISTALNCYLMQLLESGFLHADPHPGNLLRTPDGRLCVLDFGLMTEVTEDQRYTLIEYISHLVNSDYARVAEDLVRLGFVPPEFVDPEKTASVVPQLSRVLGQLVQGGGARKVNIQQVTDDLANISKDYVFVIPPYFALILRAFSVLEGIGLDADPDYTIVDECYPYISKRLLTDDSPRTRAALQYFLYGGKSQLDPVRVEEITSGFQNFRELMVPTNGSEGPSARLKPIDPATKEALLLLFSPNGSFVQDLLLAELVRAVDALSRQALAELWNTFATSLRIPLPPGFLVPGSWPLPLPGLVLGLNTTAKLTDEDLQSLETVKRIWALLEPQFQQRGSLAEVFEVAQDVLPFFRDLLPGIASSSRRFLVMLLQRQALRLADDLEAANIKKGAPIHSEHSTTTISTKRLPAPKPYVDMLLIDDGRNEVELLQLEAASLSRSSGHI